MQQLVSEPMMASSVVRVMTLLGDSRVTPDRLAAHIEEDPDLSASVLRLASSALLGMSRRISSVMEAVVVLGLNRVASLSVASGVSRMLRAVPDVPGFKPGGLLVHSVAVGLAARTLALRVYADVELADRLLLAGLLHEVPMLYRGVDHARGVSWKYVDPARKAFLAMRLWRVPQAVADVVRYQRVANECGLGRECAMLRMADAVASGHGIGIEDECAYAWVVEHDLDALCISAKDWLALAESIGHELPEQAGAVAYALSRGAS